MKEKKGKPEATAVVPVEAKVLISNRALIAKIKEKGSALLDEAKGLLIKDADTRARAAELRAQAKQLNKDTDEKFDHARDAAYKIYCLVKDGITDMKADPDKAVKVLDEAMSDYDLEQIRLAKIEQEKAEREKARLDKIERDRLEAQAKKAEAKGNEEKAEFLREQAAQVDNFVPFNAGPEKTQRTDSGTTSGSKDFDVFIREGMTVLRSIVAGTIMPGAVRIKKDNEGNILEMTITPATIKKIAEMNIIGDMLPTIPGCKLVPKVSYGSRTVK